MTNNSKKNDEVNLEISDLPGVGAITAKRLIEGGYSTLNSIATAPVKDLVETVKIGEKSAHHIIESAREAMKIGFMSGNEVWQKRKKLNKITTGSSKLDELLGGGIESGCLIEFFGEFRTGKTQLCHQLCVNVQFPLDEFGLEGNALYIDTEGTFRPERIIQMAEGYGLDYNLVLDNIT